MPCIWSLTFCVDVYDPFREWLKLSVKIRENAHRELCLSRCFPICFVLYSTNCHWCDWMRYKIPLKSYLSLSFKHIHVKYEHFCQSHQKCLNKLWKLNFRYTMTYKRSRHFKKIQKKRENEKQIILYLFNWNTRAIFHSCITLEMKLNTATKLKVKYGVNVVHLNLNVLNGRVIWWISIEWILTRNSIISTFQVWIVATCWKKKINFLRS